MQRDFVSMAIDVLYITQAHCFVALILLLRKHTLRGMELKLSPAVEDVPFVLHLTCSRLFPVVSHDVQKNCQLES